MTSRREFCATAGTVVGGCLVAGTAAGQSETTVTGTVESAVGTSLGDSHIVFVRHDPFKWFRADIDSDGGFSISLPVDTDYDVVYFDQEQGSAINGDFDGAPAIADLDGLTVDSGTGDIGTYTVPESYVINIRIEDPDGNPLQNVPLSFYTRSGNGTGPSTYTTNEYGQVIHYDNDRPGIELTGSMRVSTHPPGGEGGETLGTVFANEPKSVTLVLPNPGDYRNVIVREDVEGTATPGIVEDTATPETADDMTTPTGADESPATPMESSVADGTTGQSAARRGFFSNDADEPAALSNPMNLTVGGFVLSVAGIVYQMIGGK